MIFVFLVEEVGSVFNSTAAICIAFEQLESSKTEQ